MPNDLDIFLPSPSTVNPFFSSHLRVHVTFADVVCGSLLTRGIKPKDVSREVLEEVLEHALRQSIINIYERTRLRRSEYEVLDLKKRRNQKSNYR